ncbi:hypothetical protein ACYRDJ_003691 [Yersinia enterocolitica]
MSKKKPNIVYVIGAGLSAGLGFPTIGNLLQQMWDRLEEEGISDEISKIIRFHHPSFNPKLVDTYPNIEQLLSEMQANEQLFDSSRPATGNFTSETLQQQRQKLLLELANWFHDLKVTALNKPQNWLNQLVSEMKDENAQVISFNWDLLLDELLFGDEISPHSYGFGDNKDRVRLIKPHGSLNWYEKRTGKYLKEDKKFKLIGKGEKEVFAFRPFRSPKSTKRAYMPLIIPPVYAKQFEGDTFRHLWQETVSVLSSASEVRFLGYSLAPADFHARFILRCGFHNQEAGALRFDGDREEPTGRAKVTIVDPQSENFVFSRISDVVGWDCTQHRKTIEEWIDSK